MLTATCSAGQSTDESSLFRKPGLVVIGMVGGRATVAGDGDAPVLETRLELVPCGGNERDFARLALNDLHQFGLKYDGLVSCLQSVISRRLQIDCRIKI